MPMSPEQLLESAFAGQLDLDADAAQTAEASNAASTATPATAPLVLSKPLQRLLPLLLQPPLLQQPLLLHLLQARRPLRMTSRPARLLPASRAATRFRLRSWLKLAPSATSSRRAAIRWRARTPP
ncbi:hypothetical protein ACHFCA_10510 [Delftia tsuruhatensis]